MGNYEDARKYNRQSRWCTAQSPVSLTAALHSLDLLLTKEPENMQAQSLEELIDKAVTKGTSRSSLLRFPS